MPLTGDPSLDTLHVRVLTEHPIPADAIVWLQGNGYDRGAKALELFVSRYAPVLVVSGNDRVQDPRTTPPRPVVAVVDLVEWLRGRGVPDANIIVDTRSFHTRDQAVHVLAYAQECHWRTMLLVTSPHHQLRAYLTFMKRAKEIGWVGRIVNQPAALLWEKIPSEHDRSAREVFLEERLKLERHGMHVVSIAMGLAHIDGVGRTDSI